MAPLFLLTAAFGVLIVALLIGLARYMDRRVRLLASDENVADLHATIDELRARQAHLLERVEHLEAIVTTEDWDAAAAGRAPTTLDVPDEAPETQPDPRPRSQQRP